LVRLLGEGGMGEVWEARQCEPIKRTVAVKLIRLGMDSKKVVARFESERQALALMEHPGIATVLDGGATRAGRPYFVMEYVDGVAITDYCDAHRLVLRQRLELFIKVCEGVQHAHHKGVMHRDLKPSNILVAEVDGRAVPKIIDFGVAKATEQPLTDKTLQTVAGGWIGTPAYMSPEQAEITEDIDTRTDVYSLGCVLYELLSGRRPLDRESLSTTGFDEVRRLIREVEPPRPSLRVATASDSGDEAARARSTEVESLAGLLRGDLDWIVMKALEKERDRRYGSPAELAADIQRHLDLRPVLATPPSRSYRARKFMARHRFGVAATAGISTALLVGAGMATWQAVRATRAEERLLVRQAQAEELITFMVGDLRTKLEEVGRLEVLDEVGSQTLDYFSAFDRSDLSDTELLRRAEALTQIGDLYLKRGQLDSARHPFEEALVAAQYLVARAPGDGERLVGLGAAQFWLAYLHKMRGDLPAARGGFSDYLATAQRLVALDPANPVWRMELAYAHNGLGTLVDIGLPAEGAIEHLRASVDLMADLAADDSSNLLLRRELANARSWLADALLLLGRGNEALGEVEGNLHAMQELVALQPENLDWRWRAGIAHAQVARVLFWLGRTEESGRHRQASLEIHQGLLEADPANTQYGREAALQHGGLARIALETGAVAVALEGYARSREMLGAIAAVDQSNSEIRRELARTQIESARALIAALSYRQALELTSRASAMLRGLHEKNPQHHGLGVLLGDALLVQAAATEALLGPAPAKTTRIGALEVLEADAAGSNDPLQILALAEAYLAVGRVEEGRDRLGRAAQTDFRRPDFVRLCEMHEVSLG
jgi:serine/threonine protein kinase/tetratricopeptide (TPR) repeat protein